MTTISGKCLCGSVTYQVTSEPLFTNNCHCTDCRAATGAAYSTICFFKTDELTIQGETKSYAHNADSGSHMKKKFCPSCGSQLFSENSARDGVTGIRAGTIDQTDQIKPDRNLFKASKIPSTLIDEGLPTFDGMPTG